MSDVDALYEVFGPLPQGAPGNDATTLRALGVIPDRDSVRQVLDLGAGHGRTTLALARALPKARVLAVEIYPPFVERIVERAREEGVADRVQAVCEDMETIDIAEGSVDLVWAEGSIYIAGMERALSRWRPWLRPGGCAAFSDLVWWTGNPSKECREYWAMAYPDMATEDTIRSRFHSAGYRGIESFRMSRDAHDAYYIPLEARMAGLAGSANTDVLQVLEDLRVEIDVLRQHADDAGYTFFVIRREDG